MIIEIKGIGLPNRGAELMLIAIIEQFEQRGLDVEFVVEPTSSFFHRKKYQLLTKTRCRFKRIDFGFFLSLLPRVVREKYGLINQDQIELVLDASGFAYGDTWGVNLIRWRLASEIKKLKTRKIPLILLPQAFGSFDNKQIRRMSKEILQYSDISFARDEVSYSYLAKLLPGSSARIAPDFTNLIKVETYSEYDYLSERVAIVPNFQLIKRGDNKDYVSYLANVANLVRRKGKHPFLLVHEGEKDRVISEQIKQQVDFIIDIVDPQDAKKIKYVISISSLIIASRFHALVSALSNGIPAFSIGWSHKYEQLLSDYDVPELCLGLTEDAAEMAELGRWLEDDQKLLTLSSTIENRAKEIVEKTHEMWDVVFDLLNEYQNR